MTKSRVISFAMLALLGAMGNPLRAQSTPAIELAFGYECGDRFIVRNDGAQPVLVEYAPAGSEDRSQLHLAGKQAAEVAMAEDGNLDLFVGGKLVASAKKGNRPCAASGTKAQGDSVARGGGAPPDSTAPSDSAGGPGGVFAFMPPSDIFIYPPLQWERFFHYYPHPGPGPAAGIYRDEAAPAASSETAGPAASGETPGQSTSYGAGSKSVAREPARTPTVHEPVSKPAAHEAPSRSGSRESGGRAASSGKNNGRSNR